MNVRKICTRIPANVDLIIDELAELSGESRSVVVRMLLLASITRITDDNGEIDEDFADQIKQSKQRVRTESDRKELQSLERFFD